ncbi:tRNA (adenosine(37)-N6)-dimethylallyltransferase MiaA [Alkaliflexus imshenetskii]|uniref:tRNA (adenosine(37)-N6)-dimethylallyltransferase MiaA n=1 Tax=Alkaliflexus imshenetskii TaxID=286730 RepID=UPI00047D563F|nr:tRNA (adenosine(37)-N6)-dimethylallyltransferase MiaA [Alkaliflexus imshenetskii]
MSKLMVVIAGPTGIGKTRTGIHLAQQFNSSIISADSRQVYKEIPIGTAAPTAEEQSLVPHYLIGTKSIFDYYSAWEFEQDALSIAAELFNRYDIVFMVGGSMMYIDVFCNGVDDLPTVDPQLRNDLMERLENEGLDAIRLQLKLLDPVFYEQVDLKNPKRVIHAVEICLMTGKPYSSLRTKTKKERPFDILKIGLNMERNELYNRINRRVLQMMDDGLESEAQQLVDHQNLNALNTVGFKELFACFNGHHSMEKAVELIQRNSRHYAKKQLSWFRRDEQMQWFHPEDTTKISEIIRNHLSGY